MNGSCLRLPLSVRDLDLKVRGTSEMLVGFETCRMGSLNIPSASLCRRLSPLIPRLIISTGHKNPLRDHPETGRSCSGRSEVLRRPSLPYSKPTSGHRYRLLYSSRIRKKPLDMDFTSSLAREECPYLVHFGDGEAQCVPRARNDRKSSQNLGMQPRKQCSLWTKGGTVYSSYRHEDEVPQSLSRCSVATAPR